MIERIAAAMIEAFPLLTPERARELAWIAVKNINLKENSR